MKKQILAFTFGVLATILLSGLIVTSLAISGQMTITVDPINIQVDGQVFQPKDPNGKDVPVFQYEGTTYAPLRALAEAYGLEVGYDPEANLATVGRPPVKPDDSGKDDSEKMEYQEFSAMWSVKLVKITAYNEKLYDAVYIGSLSEKDFESMWLEMDNVVRETFAEKMAVELRNATPGYTIGLNFEFGSYELGYANAYEGNDYRPGGYSLSSFASNPFLNP